MHPTARPRTFLYVLVLALVASFVPAQVQPNSAAAALTGAPSRTV